MTLLLIAAVVGAGASRITLRSPEGDFVAAKEAYKKRDFQTAIEGFEAWISLDRDTFKQATALFQLGVSYSDTGLHSAAIRVHERLRFEFPNVNYGAGTLFHLARNYEALDLINKAVETRRMLEKEFPGSSWILRLKREHPRLFDKDAAG